MEWLVKGQGAANIVFSYHGDDRNLHGHVLRIRKATAHVASEVDEHIWEDVLGCTNGNPLTRELAYISNVMAPLLGEEYVHPGVPCCVPESFREHVGAHAGCSGFPALLQPDHTTFHATALQGYTGVGPAICLEIKPKWGVRPGGGSCQQQQQQQQSVQSSPQAESAVVESLVAAASSGACPSAEAKPSTGAALAAPAVVGQQCPACSSEGRSTEQQGERQGELAVVDVAAAEGTVVDVRHRYPRFLLHMLFKHVKEGAPLSYYNPLDLFSGEPGRMRRALRCLLESPSNNLRVFKDGVPVYGAGVRHGCPSSSSGAGSHATAAPTSAPSPQTCLQQLAAQLRGLVLPDSSTRAEEQRRCQGQQQQQEEKEGVLRAGSGAAGTSLGPACNGEEGAVEEEGRRGVPAAAAAVAQEEVEVEGNAGLSEEQEEVLEEVIRLAVEALQREGVLARLHAVQALDTLGPQGALRVYEEVVAALQKEDPACHPAVDSTAAQDATTTSSCTPGAGVPQAAHAGRLSALRSYLMSATAKDCGIMITLQRAQPVTPSGTLPASAAAAPAAADDENDVGGAVAAQQASVLLSSEPACSSGEGAAPASRAAAAAAASAQQPQASDCCTATTEQTELLDVKLDSDAAAAADGGLPALHAVVSSAQRLQRRSCVGLLQAGAEGGRAGGPAAYLYKVAFVDLDIKAAAKIVRHLDLERRLVACAEEQGGLLRELAERAGWRG
ncbi:hypothetical protein Agub_g2624 [Astrephomene gubernaculifera]|uniref:inositol-pentakisphosphate 2-kinase n=1 Tax=Astrephomene gubernaculifera TaxID=47775 RepID=A0AAD3DHD5_9CHLO|nr:hypothetical protein Agub_g2624 [Astrephomene gubernaculifera]